VRGHGGDLKSGARAIMSLEVILKLPERHVLLGEEVAPGRELSSGVVSIIVPRASFRRGLFEGHYVSNLFSLDEFIDISKETLQLIFKRRFKKVGNFP